MCVSDNKIRQVRFTSLTRLSFDYLMYVCTRVCLHTMCSSTNNLFKFGPIYSSIDYCNAHFVHTSYFPFLLFQWSGQTEDLNTTESNSLTYPIFIPPMSRWVAYCHDNHIQFLYTHVLLNWKLTVWKAFLSLIICLLSLPYIHWVE